MVYGELVAPEMTSRAWALEEMRIEREMFVWVDDGIDCAQRVASLGKKTPPEPSNNWSQRKQFMDGVIAAGRFSGNNSTMPKLCGISPFKSDVSSKTP